MFGKKQINMDIIVPTSKVALKTSCIKACDGDIAKAKELYDFFAKDMDSLPDFDPVKPSAFEQAKNMIGGTLSWIDNNQDKILNYYSMFQMLKGGQMPNIVQGIPPTDVPPIPSK
jgi:hypothetical protein